ncbi:hypothetical protein BDI24065_00915 [Burkholderia diffusa]|uniref:Uncharacterized protein n=1 Tax=Burkholderia diffusa TaxID=488732 RepID=A0A6P2HWW7_9BURK|nr:hypothetical protein BDI24065_00915 [Burkholderia diffusa]
MVRRRMKSLCNVDEVSHTRSSLMLPVESRNGCAKQKRAVTLRQYRHDQPALTRAGFDQRTPAPTRPPAAAPATVPTGPPVIR